VLLARCRRKGATEEHDIPLEVRIWALAPEEAWACLCAKLARRQDVLFGIVTLLEFCRGYSAPHGWTRMRDVARQLGVGDEVRTAAQMTARFVDADPVRRVLVDLAGTDGTPPRLFEWARYGPAERGRYAAFKKPFLYTLGFLSVDGLRQKFAYFLKGIAGDTHTRPVLPRLILDMLFGACALLVRRTSRQPRVYWAESREVVPQAVASASSNASNIA
jgi:hypothetical protein